MKVCLVQYNPVYPKPCQLDAYNEVVESYHWGFAALGHEVTRLINHCDPTALNIVFGFMIPYQLKLLDSFPPGTIIFNMEQGVRKAWINSNVHYALSKYQWWDYSIGNVAALSALSPRFPVYYAKTAYAPNLEKVPVRAEQDLDVLYYGHLTADRADILEKVASQRGDLSGLSVMTLSNVWDKLRDEFISRSKVVVNLSRNNSYIFEIVRVSYLLANKKAVVCTLTDQLEIEEDLRNVLKFVNASDVQGTCQSLIEDDAARAHYAQECYALFRQRDIREVIKDFFG